MADPFSVASGAAGVISLGLTLCQGLIKYYGPFSARDSETKNLVRTVSGLKSTIEALASKAPTLQDPQNAHLTDEVRIVMTHISDCEAGLQELSQALDKCKRCDASGKIKEKGWDFARKALYPFKQGTLLGLVRIVSGLQSNLDTALHLLQIALTKRIQDQVSLTLTVSNSIATSTSDAVTSLDEILRRQEQMEQMMQTMISFQQSQTGVTSHQSTQSLLPPSSLRSLCDQQQVMSSQLLTPNSQLRRLQKINRCTCSPNRGRTPTRWSIFQTTCSHQYHCPLYLERQTTTMIQKRYVLCNTFLNFSVNLQLNATRGAGGFSIHPVFDIQSVVPFDHQPFIMIGEGIIDLGAGKVSVDIFADMLIQLKRLFDEGKASPVDTSPDGFTLLHLALSWADEVPQDYLHEYRSFVQELVISLHVPVNTQAYRRPKSQPETPLDTLVRVLRADKSTLNQSVPSWIGLVSDLLSFDASFACPLPVPDSVLALFLNPNPSMSDASYLVLSGLSELWLRELPFTEIQIAALRQSENDLKESLRNSTLENMPLGIKAAFIASVAWPKGLQMILAKTQNQDWVLRAMLEAIATSQLESVNVLLDIGRCPISAIILKAAAEKVFDPPIFRAIALCMVRRRKSLLAAAMLQLPQRLLQRLNVSSSLCIPDRQARGLYRALKKYRCKLEPQIIENDYIGFISVYNHISHNIQAADILFEVGFVDMGGERSMSLYSPLLGVHMRHVLHTKDPRERYNRNVQNTNSLLNICGWFLDKGAALFIEYPGEHVLPGHHIAREIGRAIAYFVKSFIGDTDTLISEFWGYCPKTFEDYKHLLEPLFMDSQHHDQCICACSTDGCLSSTILINRMIRPLSFAEFEHSRFLATFIGILCSSGSDTPQQIYEVLAPVIIRICTFKQLELTHTCGNRRHICKDASDGHQNRDPRRKIQRPCDENSSEAGYSEEEVSDSDSEYDIPEDYMPWWYVFPDDGADHADEVPAIRSEERLLIDRLEELVAEFEAKYAELGVPLPDFLTGYWESRMREVEAEKNIFDEEEARKMREVGVIVQD